MLSPLRPLAPYRAAPIARSAIRPVANPDTACEHEGGSHPCRMQEHSSCASCDDRLPPTCSAVHRQIAAAQYCAPCRVSTSQCPTCGFRKACECVQRRQLSEYHSRRAPLPAMPIDDDDPLIGLEIECVQDDDAKDPWGEIHHALSPIVWSIERDGSLPAGGGEIVTKPLARSTWDLVIGDVLATIASVANASRHECGGHMHVSATPLVIAGANRLCATYGQRAQRRVWDAVAGRSSGYATSTQSPFAGPIQTGTRSALYRPSASGPTIEWRHPAGTSDPRVILGRMHLFVDVLLHAASVPGAWGWGAYLRDLPSRTVSPYAVALLRSIGY